LLPLLLLLLLLLPPRSFLLVNLVSHRATIATIGSV
jgi:hypothetical protein